MARARHVTHLVLALVLTLFGSAVAAASVSLPPVFQPQAVVAWPPSSTLVIAEVVTGGASASDEYVELYNAGPVDVDLTGLEVVYATSTGSTVTRKATWAASTLLGPNRHLLIANASGTFASGADATYTGGFAATGGALAVRPVGGTPIDSLAWGDATSGFVEGTAAPAPAAGSSIERRPGGLGGNAQDTNDNAGDVQVNPSPMPQDLDAPAVPSAGPTPTPAVTPSLSPEPTATPTPSPTPEPTPTPTTTPEPTPEPTPAPTSTPVATPSPDPVISIAAARALPDDTTVSIEGVLTVDLGSVDGARGGFVQDATGGIAIHLTADTDTMALRGTLVRLTGAIDDRFAGRTIRVAPDAVIELGAGPLPEPIDVTTGNVTEAIEGQRVHVHGTVTESPSTLADGLGVTIDDGSGPTRVVIAPAALGGQVVVTGDLVEATGPVGQRDSTGSGTTGYRIHATDPGDAVVSAPPPSPTPTASPDPTPTVQPSPEPSPTPSAPTPSPQPSASATPTPTPSATPSPSPTDLQPSVAAARARPSGVTVRVRGVVIAEAGRIGNPQLIVIGDGSGGLPVRLPDGTPRPTRGTLVEVRGALAAPYGQLELKVAAGGFVTIGPATVPAPRPLAGAALGEATEGLLARLEGRLAGNPRKANGGDLSMILRAVDGTEVRVIADASSGITASALRDGGRYLLTGIVGQRASRKGALDGYRLWLRDARDVNLTAAPSPWPGASPTPRPSNTVAQALSIGRARVLRQGSVTVEGTITAGPELLDAGARRIVIEDRTGGIEVLLPSPDASMSAGRRIRVSGTIGRSYGVPRIKAETVTPLGTGSAAPRELQRPPAAGDECRLVRVSGVVVDVKRLGEKWRAELQLGRERIVISGLPGAAIPSDRLTEGASAAIVGIVRRPYPTATDRRYAIVPRSSADVAVTARGGVSEAPTAPRGTAAASGTSSAPGEPIAALEDIDLTDLVAYLGVTVRAGGLVTDLSDDGFYLDDGTDVGRIALVGDAAELLPLVEPGDAINVIGRPEPRDDEVVLVVSDPAGVIRAGETLIAPADLDPAPEPEPEASAQLAGATRQLPGFGGFELPGGPAGLVVLVLATIASGAVTVLRRMRARRVLTVRLRRRLAAIGPATSGQEG